MAFSEMSRFRVFVAIIESADFSLLSSFEELMKGFLGDVFAGDTAGRTRGEGDAVIGFANGLTIGLGLVESCKEFVNGWGLGILLNAADEARDGSFGALRSDFTLAVFGSHDPFH
jgi:hypothetical protein